jgi:hypothetical protein
MHDNNHHIESMLQGFARCGKLSGTWECDIASIWVWCKSCHSFFDGVFWSIEPYYQCVATILIEIIELNLEENMFGGGLNWKIFSNISH